MSRLIPITLLVLTFACTAANQETSSQHCTAIDSFAVVDSTRISDNEVEELSEDNEGDQDTSRVSEVYDEQLVLATNDESKYYTVSIRVSQYEGGADVTWYFDKELSPRYFKETWSMEGNEGSTEILIENGSASCLSKSDNQTEENWCAKTGGIKRGSYEGRDEKALLPADYGTLATKEFEDNLSTLKSILKDGTITSESPDSYVVRIEQTVDVGQEVTEYTEVDIPKAVYNELMP
jgi:hypothetical protein